MGPAGRWAPSGPLPRPWGARGASQEVRVPGLTWNRGQCSGRGKRGAGGDRMGPQGGEKRAGQTPQALEAERGFSDWDD